MEQDHAWDILTQKRYTPRTAKRSDELSYNGNLLDLYTAQKRFTPRKRLSDLDFQDANTFDLLVQKRYMPRAIKRVVLDQPENKALEEYLAETLEKRFTPRKRMQNEDLEQDDALELFAQKRFTPRKRLSDGLTEQEDDTLDQYTAQRTQKRYTPRKRLSNGLDEQDDIWNGYTPEDTEKRYMPRRK